MICFKRPNSKSQNTHIMIFPNTVLIGTYSKKDSFLQFTLELDNGRTIFTYKGTSQPVQWKNEKSFEITWEYGTPLFKIIDYGVLIENDTFIFEHTKIISKPQLQIFKDTGVITLHNFIDKQLITNALNSINDIIEAAKNQGELSFSGYSNSSDILALANAAWPVIAKILGENIDFPHGAQIAIKMPGGNKSLPGEIGPDLHIDGLHTPTNGVPENTIDPFNILLGIALTSVTDLNMGNFSYIPGSHLYIDEKVREWGDEEAFRTLCLPNGKVNEHRDVGSAIKSLISNTKFASPQSVCCQAGSIYLAHYQTMHFVMPNLDLTPRVAVYFRLRLKPNDFKLHLQYGKDEAGLANCSSVFSLKHKNLKDLQR